jgi:hypothetical protein
MGFSNAWMNWTSELLRSASTKVLLNGSPGQRVCHARGLGDPMSLLLFILSMEVLSALFRKADSCALLQHIGAQQIKHGVPLYADDLLCSLRRLPPISTWQTGFFKYLKVPWDYGAT